MSNEFNENISEMIDGIAQIGSDQAYFDFTSSLQSKSAADAIELARENSSVEKFKELGIPTPNGLRVSPRAFEPNTHPTKKLDNVDYKTLTELDSLDLDIKHGIAKIPSVSKTVCASIGYIVCASIGDDMDKRLRVRLPDELPYNVITPDLYKKKIQKYSHTEIKNVLNGIKDVTEQPNFSALIDQLYSLNDIDEQRKFVKTKILDNNELVKSGVVIPEDVMILRSAFEDGRNTLFALVSKLPDNKKLTITYDSE